MSPEQVVGEKVDSRSDLFSAGVVLYQLLTGHLPFEGDTLISVAYKITKTDPPSLDKVRADLPLSLRRIVERALKKQPDKRFQSGEEFAQALVGVAREIAESDQKHGRRGIPLAVRWALTMAAVVAITMTLTATVLYNQQYAAMMDQVKDYGGSLAKFTATQNAVPLLSEDWAAMDVFVQETLGRQDFNYMNVVDHQGGRAREQHCRRGQRASTCLRRRPPCRPRIPASPCKATGSPTAARSSISRRPCCSRARRSAPSTSASTRRRSPPSPISCWCCSRS